MISGLNPLIAAVSALLPGLVIGYLIRHLVASRKVTLAESKAEATLADSKTKAQEIILEAKNNAFKILEEAKKEEKERNSQLSRIENILTKKETELEQKGKELSFEKETNHVALRGHALTRGDLLQFISIIREHPSFHDVESPVENILRDKNISFTLSFTVRNEKNL